MDFSILTDDVVVSGVRVRRFILLRDHDIGVIPSFKNGTGISAESEPVGGVNPAHNMIERLSIYGNIYAEAVVAYDALIAVWE